MNNFIDNGRPHGYWERYFNDELWYKGYYLNGKENGYWEIYGFNGELSVKEFYL